MSDTVEKKEFITSFYRSAAEKGYPLRVETLEDCTPVLEFMQLTRKDRLLDIGCGAGTFVLLAKRRCWSVGIDIIAHGCRSCVQGDGEALPFSDNSFSVVYYSKSFSLMEKEHTLREVSRVAVPEGRLILRELVKSTPYDDAVSWICEQLLSQNLYIPTEYPHIPEITLQSVGEFISPLWYVAESATLTAVMEYPSVEELIDRLVYYSPLSAIAKEAPQRTELLKTIIVDGVSTFFGESPFVETTHFIIKALKNTV